MRSPIRALSNPLAGPSEDQFEQWVLAAARIGGWHGHHTRKSFGVVMGVSKEDAFGWPDWCFWHRSKGRFLVRELKTEQGKLTRFQRVVLDDLVACGIDAAVWRPSDRDEILETFAA